LTHRNQETAGRSLRILVTAIGGGGHGEQILKALVLADRDRYEIMGADANPYSPQLEWVDKRTTLPMASSPDYIDSVLNLLKREKIDALFHGCEPELRAFARHREAIESLGVFLPINPTEVIDLCMSKERTNRRLHEAGFSAPRFILLRERSGINEIDWYPVVVKPSTGGGGSANVYLAQNRTQLLALADYLGLGDGGSDFMIQEYVGTPEDEYTVGVLHDMDGNYLNSIAVRRMLSGQLNIRARAVNQTDRTDLGPNLVISSGVSHGVVGRFPVVTEQCRKIAAAIGAKGAINIQCRLVDGVVQVFEINPRFSGTTSIRAMVGYNEPDTLIRKHVLGETIETDFSYEEAVVIRGLTETRLAMNPQ
jgi:carbamoyl-phosphate synthase large subunit